MTKVTITAQEGVKKITLTHLLKDYCKISLTDAKRIVDLLNQGESQTIEVENVKKFTNLAKECNVSVKKLKSMYRNKITISFTSYDKLTDLDLLHIRQMFAYRLQGYTTPSDPKINGELTLSIDHDNLNVEEK